MSDLFFAVCEFEAVSSTTTALHPPKSYMFPASWCLSSTLIEISYVRRSSACFL